MRTRNLRLCAALSLTLIACEGSGDASSSADAELRQLPERIARITATVETPLRTCGDRVWPGMGDGWRSAQLLLVRKNARTAHLWNDQAGGRSATTSVPFEELGPQHMRSYALAPFRGVPTVSIGVDEAREAGTPLSGDATLWHDGAASLAFHEGFHYLVQRAWPRPAAGATRFAPFPEPAEPRYLQRMFGVAMRDALLGSGDLGAAAHWRSEMRRRWPDEVLRASVTDQREGSAEYAEAMANAVTELGCAATDRELVAAVIPHLSQFVRLDQPDADGEAYSLGTLAGLLLRDRGVASWEEEVAGGKTQMDVLAETFAPSPQIDDPAVRAEIEAKVAEKNARYAAEVAGLVTRMTSAEYVRVVLPLSWNAGAFRARGFIRLVEQPETPSVYLSYQAGLQSPAGDRIAVGEQSVMVDVAQPCGEIAGAVIVSTVPTSALTGDAGRFTSAGGAGGATFTALPATLTTQAGLPWLCPVVAPIAPAAVRNAEDPLDESDARRGG